MFRIKKLKLEEGDEQRRKLGNCSFAKKGGSRLSKISWMKQRNELNPFEVFPLEVWYVILEQLEDSREILNVLRAIPQLDISINKEKRYWYIDQILPYIYRWIDLNDILTLRLVCKQWQRRVDHYFIPNQPLYRAYSEDLHKDNVNFWNWKFAKVGFKLNCYDVCAPTMASDYENDSLSNPENKTPFLVRHLKMDIQNIDNPDYKFFCMNTDQPKDIQLYTLEQFGRHVWYLDIDFQMIGHQPVTTQNFTNLVKTFNFTPNIKRVELILHDWYVETNETWDFDVLERLPELPSLESLKIKSSPRKKPQTEEFVRVLVTRFGPQIRELSMPLMYWRVDEFKDLFPQLTGLSLELHYYNYLSRYDNLEAKSLLKNLLDSISAPNLAMLQLSISETELKYELSIENDLLKWLKRFPKLQHLRMDCVVPGQIVWKESGTADPVNDSIPSLQTLKIPNGAGLSYNFLRCFPSLSQLEIQPYAISSKDKQPSAPESSVKLKEKIKTRKLYESNIWELLPTLRNVNMVTVIGTYDYYFKRATYEKMKKKADKVSSK